MIIPPNSSNYSIYYIQYYNTRESTYNLYLLQTISMRSHYDSKSSQIKSKKDKMNEKRSEKLLTLNSYAEKQKAQKKIYQVLDDSQKSRSASVEVLETIPSILKEMQKIKEDDALITKQRQQKFNKFNFDRINKMIVPLKSQPKPFVLNVEQCDDGINVNVVQDARSINYKKVGSKIPHKTCQNFLKNRLEKIGQEEKNAEQKKISKDQYNLQNVFANGEDKVEAIQRNRRIPRYFDNEVAALQSERSEQEGNQQQEQKKEIRCFRCGQRGHIARMCDKQQTIKCVYCLGHHFNSECNERICRNCGQSGHIKSECHERVDRIRCNKCNRLGHIMRNCGRIVMMGYKAHREKEIREKYSREDLQKLKCLKCNGYKDSKGHFNCHEYTSKYPKIYDEGYIYV